MNFKRVTVYIGLAVGVILVLMALSSFAQNSTIQNPKKTQTMKVNAGIITKKLKESKEFYTRYLNFGVTFENEFYVLLHTPDHQTQISFLLPDHPSQQGLFQPAFTGHGVYLTVEVEDVDNFYEKLKSLKVPIAIPLRDEPWGDRHFAIVDPNGVGIDIVTYTPSDTN